MQARDSLRALLSTPSAEHEDCITYNYVYFPPKRSGLCWKLFLNIRCSKNGGDVSPRTLKNQPLFQRSLPARFAREELERLGDTKAELRSVDLGPAKNLLAIFCMFSGPFLYRPRTCSKLSFPPNSSASRRIGPTCGDARMLPMVTTESSTRVVNSSTSLKMTTSIFSACGFNLSVASAQASCTCRQRTHSRSMFIKIFQPQSTPRRNGGLFVGISLSPTLLQHEGSILFRSK